MSSPLPPSPGSRAPSWRGTVEELADRVGTSSGALVAVVVALALGAVVVAVLWPRQEAAPPELSIPYASGSGPGVGATSTTVAEEPVGVTVHVAGAVLAPGVYVLAGAPRVGDAIAAAGGPLDGADLERLNLAAPVVDGSRLYVPRTDQSEVPGVLGADVVAGEPGSNGTTPSGLIDLNRADAATLDELPGVGPATAAAIVAHRDEHGPFTSVDELLEVRGIGEAKLAAIRDLVAI